MTQRLGHDLKKIIYFNIELKFIFHNAHQNGMIRILLFLFSLIVFASCQSMPEGAEAVTDFRKEKYLGSWYEIARLDHRFERNLTIMTAEYSLKMVQ